MKNQLTTPALPEPAGLVVGADSDGNVVVEHDCEGRSLEDGQVLYTDGQMRDYAAACVAVKDAEIERLNWHRQDLEQKLIANDKAIAQAAQPAAPPAILYLRDEACGSGSNCNRWYGSALAEAGKAWRELTKDGRQVWLLCLGVAGQLASHEEMQWRFGTPKSDFACPVCGKGTPHQHSAQAIELRRYGDEVTVREMDKRWAEIEALAQAAAR